MAVITSFSFETLRHFISILLLLVSLVQSDCERGGTCNDADKLLADIAADTKSHQQLLQAFYPINRAQPAYMVVAYFLNFTGAFPEQCDGHYHLSVVHSTSQQCCQYSAHDRVWSVSPCPELLCPLQHCSVVAGSDHHYRMTEFGLSVPACSTIYIKQEVKWSTVNGAHLPHVGVSKIIRDRPASRCHAVSAVFGAA